MQNALGEAEEHWQRVVAEQPGFLPVWLGLAELYIAQASWSERDALTERLAMSQGRVVEAIALRARSWLARRDFGMARPLLEDVIPQAPHAVWPRVLFSHVLLQEGKDWDAAEQGNNTPSAARCRS